MARWLFESTSGNIVFILIILFSAIDYLVDKRVRRGLALDVLVGMSSYTSIFTTIIATVSVFESLFRLTQ